jgi:hypothetical protein
MPPDSYLPVALISSWCSNQSLDDYMQTNRTEMLCGYTDEFQIRRMAWAQPRNTRFSPRPFIGGKDAYV